MPVFGGRRWFRLCVENYLLYFCLLWFSLLFCCVKRLSKSESPLKKKKWSHWDRSCAAANFLHLIVCKHFYRQNQLHILFCFCCSFNCSWFGCFLPFFFVYHHDLCVALFFFFFCCVYETYHSWYLRVSVFLLRIDINVAGI